MTRDFLKKTVIFVHFDRLSFLIRFNRSSVDTLLAICEDGISQCALGKKHFLGKKPAVRFQIAFGLQVVTFVSATADAVAVLGHFEDLLGFENPHVCLARVVDLIRV